MSIDGLREMEYHPRHAHSSTSSTSRRCRSVLQLKQLHCHLCTLRSFSLSSIAAIASAALSDTAATDMDYARKMFDNTPEPNRFMYNTLIRAYCSSSRPQESLHLLKRMLQSCITPNRFTLPFLIKASVCCDMPMNFISSIHALGFKLGLSTQVNFSNALLHAHCISGSILAAARLFVEMPEKSVVSWNTLIDGYAQSGRTREAFVLFNVMRSQGVAVDSVTMVSLLVACSQAGDLAFGRAVHGAIAVSGVKMDMILGNALLDMYGKCQCLEMVQSCFDRMPRKNIVTWTSVLWALAKHGPVDVARTWFDQMPEKNIVSWNAMISSCLRHGLWSEVLDLHEQMNDATISPDEVTVAAVLSACSQNGNVIVGKKVHQFIYNHLERPGTSVVNSLLDMYAKCGELGTAMNLFSTMSDKDVVSWNVIIGALALHGRAFAAIEFFKHMVADGFAPDQITFVGVLSACSHGGLLEAGRYYFSAMTSVFGVPREVEHYGCMVDLFGRCGKLENAVKLIQHMPFKPDFVIWSAMLGACRIHGNVSIGEQIVKQLLELEGSSGGLFVLVSNMFSYSKKWQDTEKLRKLMKACGVKKDMGVSSIQIYNDIHEFGVEDEMHESSSDIYLALEQLYKQIMSSCVHGVSVEPENQLYVNDQTMFIIDY